MSHQTAAYLWRGCILTIGRLAVLANEPYRHAAQWSAVFDASVTWSARIIAILSIYSPQLCVSAAVKATGNNRNPPRDKPTFGNLAENFFELSAPAAAVVQDSGRASDKLTKSLTCPLTSLDISRPLPRWRGELFQAAAAMP